MELENNGSENSASESSESLSAEQTTGGDVASQPTQSTQGESGTQPPAEKAEVPFHEHPRFRELIETKNTQSQKLQEYERRFQEMQAKFSEYDTRIPKPKSETDELFERLEKVDPAFGKLVKQMAEQNEKLSKQVEEFSGWRNQSQEEVFQTQVSSNVENLFAQNKITPEWQDIYRHQMTAVANSIPNAGMEHLPKIFEQVHSRFQAALRAERASYVQSKKQDVAPSGAASRGKPINNVPTPKPMSKADVIAQITQEIRDSKNNK